MIDNTIRSVLISVNPVCNLFEEVHYIYKLGFNPTLMYRKICIFIMPKINRVIRRPIDKEDIPNFNFVHKWVYLVLYCTKVFYGFVVAFLLYFAHQTV